MDKQKQFLASFAKFGFSIDRHDQTRIVGHADGKDVGVYLTIDNDTFSVDVIFHFMEQKVFYWQHFDSYAEIEALIIKNHILSEQLCEQAGLAVHT